jgi:ATP:ADP antiporter, AAA family
MELIGVVGSRFVSTVLNFSSSDPAVHPAVKTTDDRTRKVTNILLRIIFIFRRKHQCLKISSPYHARHSNICILPVISRQYPLAATSGRNSTTTVNVLQRQIGYTRNMLKRFIDVKAHEVSALLWSFGYFFCLLSSYYVLRPVRDEMGVQIGANNLPWFFTATFITMLAIVPLFGWLVTRFPRRILIPSLYLFFIVNLICFYGALQIEATQMWATRVFFVWLSVFNLFAVSVFWSFMVDLFTDEQGKRLFGFIAAGGTAGAIAGPALIVTLVEMVGVPALLLFSAAFLTLAVICVNKLGKWPTQTGVVNNDAGGAAVGGGIFGGLRGLFSSPYLIGVCVYLLCHTVLSTLLYVEMASLLPQKYSDPSKRAEIFAALDLSVNILTLLIQLLVTAKAFKRLGVTITLTLLPALAVVGFLVLGIWPLLMVVIVFGVIRRAGEFALSKPAREILFTVIPREAKYKAKNVIDTLIYRGGETLSGWLTTLLRGAAGLDFSGIAFAAIPIAGAWCAVSVWLGRRQQALSQSNKD